MCGLNGLFAFNPAAGPPSERELCATRDHMAARGPDGIGEFWSPDRRLGLGHRRLSIIDLSDRASQPMRSADGNLTVVFNGEIYNYPALRAELEQRGRMFRTNSDTEVLLHLYELEGEAMVERLRGMFAFAIWDATRRGLFLARDPYGIKPLYTANDGWIFRFASQVKALLAGGEVSRDPEPAGVVGFQLWGSVPEPFTLYREIRALPAGCTQWIDAAGPRTPRAYASVAELFAQGASARCARSDAEAILRRAVGESVAAHLLSDVEVGVFLSSGVDSGALLGLMRDAGQSKIRAITLAFEEFRGKVEDEAPLAAEIAQLYGAEHIVRRVDRKEFEQDLPDILAAMDQPSIDGVNTWFVAKAAREAGLKVAMSGLGGDELLAGYPSFREIPKWVRWLTAPAAIPGLGRAARMVGSAVGLGRKRPKLLGMLEYGGTYEGAYQLRRGLFLPFELSGRLDPDTLRQGVARLHPLERVRKAGLEPAASSAISRVAAMESACYMRNQLLRDSDWAGMAHSLEIRTPLVDIELLRRVAPIVPGMAPGVGKRLLANAPSHPLPKTIVERTKTGFVVPTGRWMANLAAGAAPPHAGDTSRSWAGVVLASPLPPIVG